MAKPNYQYEKRQRELAKKAKKAEKAARKASRPDDADAQTSNEDGAVGQTETLEETSSVEPQTGGSVA